MSDPDPDADADRLSRASLQAGDPTGWFESLYAEAAEGRAVVPWDRGGPHPRLVEWVEAQPAPEGGPRALVVGAGPGSDAAYLDASGWTVTAFDIAPTAVAAAQRRFPAVEFVVADLLDPPVEWTGGYDLVVESYTVQSLPVALRAQATQGVRRFVAPGGQLLVLAAAADRHGADGPPWPLTPSDLEAFAADGLRRVRVETLLNPAGVAVWRGEFRRA